MANNIKIYKNKIQTMNFEEFGVNPFKIKKFRKAVGGKKIFSPRIFFNMKPDLKTHHLIRPKFPNSLSNWKNSSNSSIFFEKRILQDNRAPFYLTLRHHH